MGHGRLRRGEFAISPARLARPASAGAILRATLRKCCFHVEVFNGKLLRSNHRVLAIIRDPVRVEKDPSSATECAACERQQRAERLHARTLRGTGEEVHAWLSSVAADREIDRNRDNKHHRGHGGHEQPVTLNQSQRVGNQFSRIDLRADP